ncbi:hypothetical protein A2U01_0048998, partial [Trifolium medium]|nr:hypothetical protein [Trifolium medium]
EWIENTPLWETDPYEHTEPDELMEIRASTTLTNEERMQLLREEAVEEWLDEMKTKWKTPYPEPTPFIPKPKTEEHKEWVKRWKICYQVAIKSKFGTKTMKKEKNGGGEDVKAMTWVKKKNNNKMDGQMT